MTSRVEGYPLSQAWRSSTGGCPFMTLDLAPLRREDSIKLAGSFIDTVNQKALDCIQRAEGNPLFLEQLLRNVEEHGDGDIPASIQSLVLARIDRLPAADKQALQAASVLGQRFELEALRHLIDVARLRLPGADRAFAHSPRGRRLSFRPRTGAGRCFCARYSRTVVSNCIAKRRRFSPAAIRSCVLSTSIVPATLPPPPPIWKLVRSRLRHFVSTRR